MAIRDRVLDESIAIAKSCSHPEVEPRHVLPAIVRVLGAEALPDLTPAAARQYLGSPGNATKPPTVGAAAQTAIDACTSSEDAIAQARALAAQLASEPGAGEDAAPTEGGPGAAVAVQAEAAGATASPATSNATPGKENVKELLAELDALVGLEPVKVEIRKLIAVQRMNAERRRNDLPEIAGSAHLVFTGDPGTGKTTVARLVARLYGSIGVVSRGHLVEASRADLVAGYVGQTALKVQDAVSSALGGVLFIDEAYALTGGGSADFGAEAVATLVKLMEDHRDNLAVIVAGYRDEMWEFIHSNPGLKSRFTHYIDFPNYKAEELVGIFESMAAESKLRLDEGVPARARELFTEASRDENYGNARFVRSVFERAYANLSARAVADDRIDSDELDLLTTADLPANEPMSGGRHGRIGFRQT